MIVEYPLFSKSDKLEIEAHLKKLELEALGNAEAHPDRRTQILSACEVSANSYIQERKQKAFKKSQTGCLWILVGGVVLLFFGIEAKIGFLAALGGAFIPFGIGNYLYLKCQS